MKKSKKQTNKINTPWYKEYKDVPSHLEYPNSTMINYLEECSKDRLHKLAFKYYGKSYTFKSMLESIDNIARSLKALGIAEDDKVTICMPNTPEGVMTFYAVNKIGAVANMIHPLSSEKEIEFYVNNVESKFILTVDVACQKILNIVENTSLEKVSAIHLFP